MPDFIKIKVNKSLWVILITDVQIEKVCQKHKLKLSVLLKFTLSAADILFL